MKDTYLGQEWRLGDTDCSHVAKHPIDFDINSVTINSETYSWDDIYLKIKEVATRMGYSNLEYHQLRGDLRTIRKVLLKQNDWEERIKKEQEED